MWQFAYKVIAASLIILLQWITKALIYLTSPLRTSSSIPKMFYLSRIAASLMSSSTTSPLLLLSQILIPSCCFPPSKPTIKPLLSSLYRLKLASHTRKLKEIEGVRVLFVNWSANRIAIGLASIPYPASVARVSVTQDTAIAGNVVKSATKTANVRIATTCLISQNRKKLPS